MGDVGLLHVGVGCFARRGDRLSDRQLELLGELEVALVMGRHGHDRPGPIRGQHVVGDEDRDPLAVDRVDRVGADRHAGLLALGRQPFDLGLALRRGNVGLDLGLPVGRRQLRDERVLGREHHERGAEQRVGSSREHADLVAARLVVVRRRGEHDLGTL